MGGVSPRSGGGASSIAGVTNTYPHLFEVEVEVEYAYAHPNPNGNVPFVVILELRLKQWERLWLAKWLGLRLLLREPLRVTQRLELCLLL